MTPKQALAIIDDLCAKALLNRANHQAVSQAISVLNRLVQSTSPVEELEDEAN
jgi:hypothetical protein